MHAGFKRRSSAARRCVCCRRVCVLEVGRMSPPPWVSAALFRSNDSCINYPGRQSTRRYRPKGDQRPDSPSINSRRLGFLLRPADQGGGGLLLLLDVLSSLRRQSVAGHPKDCESRGSVACELLIKCIWGLWRSWREFGVWVGPLIGRAARVEEPLSSQHTRDGRADARSDSVKQEAHLPALSSARGPSIMYLITNPNSTIQPHRQATYCC